MDRGSYALASRNAAQRGAPVWIYRMEWETPILDGRLGAPHALEIPPVFDTVAKSSSFIADGADEAQKVAEYMSESDPTSPATAIRTRPRIYSWLGLKLKPSYGDGRFALLFEADPSDSS